MAIVNTAGFLKHARKHLDAQRRVVAARLTAQVANDILTEWPVESGHAHEAFLEGFEQAANSQALVPNGVAITRVVKAHDGKGSKDQKAAAAGSGNATDGKDRTTVRVRNALPFVKDIETGGVIIPLIKGKSGPKKDRRKSPGGPLFGPRKEYTGGPGGVGFLAFFIEGRLVFSRQAVRSGDFIVKKALDRVK